jgi:hypothetical protein
VAADAGDFDNIDFFSVRLKGDGSNFEAELFRKVRFVPTGQAYGTRILNQLNTNFIQYPEKIAQNKKPSNPLT